MAHKCDGQTDRRTELPLAIARSIDVSVVIVTNTLAIVIAAVITIVLTMVLQCFRGVSL